jgi:hypothetical protein
MHALEDQTVAKNTLNPFRLSEKVFYLVLRRGGMADFKRHEPPAGGGMR